MIHAQHFPLERLYKRGRFKVEDFRKEVLANFTVSIRANPDFHTFMACVGMAGCFGSESVARIGGIGKNEITIPFSTSCFIFSF